jgi:hypothetical protein
MSSMHSIRLDRRRSCSRPTTSSPRQASERLCRTSPSSTVERPLLELAGVVPYLLDELNRAPELAMQKGYLARVLTAGEDGVRDDGILPLEVFVDGERDGVAATVEFDAEETIRPVVYVRSAGALQERVLPSHPLRRYDDTVYRKTLGEFLRPLLGVS